MEKITIDNLPIHINLYYRIGEKQSYAHIQTRDFSGKQDAKIGDFSENWYCRPAKAVKSIPYKTLGSYKTACRLSFKRIKPEATDLYFGFTTDLDGVEYITKI